MAQCLHAYDRDFWILVLTYHPIENLDLIWVSRLQPCEEDNLHILRNTFDLPSHVWFSEVYKSSSRVALNRSILLSYSNPIYDSLIIHLLYLRAL